MIAQKLRTLGLLLYKSFLVRIVHFDLAVFFEVLIPILLYVSAWGVRNLGARPPQEIGQNVIHPVKPPSVLDVYSSKYFLVVPDNNFIQKLMENSMFCLKATYQDTVIKFKTEEEMLHAYHTNFSVDQHNSLHTFIGIVFQNKSIDLTAEKFDYKVLTNRDIPNEIYSNILPGSLSAFELEITLTQICLDKSIIQMKRKNPSTNIIIDTQEMPEPAHLEPDVGDQIFRQIFCAFAVAAFLVPLCIETSYASNEKFLGINVLMNMNGVPNYLNLLSWLISGIIISLLYTVPIVILLNFTSSEYNNPFLYFGNSFIFWLILTLNVIHLITFGMHISAYFTRSLFVITGIIIIYVGSTVLQQYGIKEHASTIVPYLGILFPNILLFRAIDEVNYYETTAQGVHWDNLFRAGNRTFGVEGSIGMVFIFSIVGFIFHFLMANYIYAINPGKYGVRKDTFYFLKFIKRSKQSSDSNEVENIEFNNMKKTLFEPVNEGTPGIRIRNLKKIYSTGLFRKEKVYALKGVTADFYKGQIAALLGHNGAGKTTMMSILTGMISATEGVVLINGMDVKYNLEEIMNDMGLCPQENMLFPNLTVAEQLKFFAMLKNKHKMKSVIESKVEALLEKLKLSDKKRSLPKELSGGQKRRVSLGMALIGDPSVLVLDEPTSGLDPESKRGVWDLLLKIRGQTTILISTHDMEEADILGDRIAIVHTGQLRSLGSSMFLKKHLGQGNVEITLSTKPWYDVEKIHNFFDSQSEIVSKEKDKVIISTPFNNDLPDVLDKIEVNKKDIGVTGMSVSLITLEKVFLKVTRDEDDNTESKEPFTSVSEKLEGQQLMVNSMKALLLKKLTYTKKNISATLIMLILFAASLTCITFMLMDHSSWQAIPAVSIGLEMYSHAKVHYRTDNNSKTFGQNYKTMAEDSGAQVFDDSYGYPTLVNALLKVGMKDISEYRYHHFIGAEFDSDPKNTKTIVLYNPTKALFAQPISINLATNSLIKTLVDKNHEIKFSVQEFPTGNFVDMMSVSTQGLVEGYVAALVLVFFIYPAVALFVIHPAREAITNVKHLQRMAGVSCFGYWGTMFAFDFLVFLTITVLFVVAFVLIDTGLQIGMFFWCETFILLLLFILFSINVLPIAYIFSFWKRPASAAIKLLSLLPSGLVLVEVVMSIIDLALHDDEMKWLTIRRIQKGFFLLTPYISFFHGQFSFFKTAKTNAACRKLVSKNISMPQKTCDIGFDPCCNVTCTNGVCKNALKYFNDFEEDMALETAILSLCLTPILYIGILCILEYKLVPKLNAKIFNSKPDDNVDTFEEQVLREKQYLDVKITKIKNLNDATKNGKNSSRNNTESDVESALPDNYEVRKDVFLVHELRKLYGGLIAVKNVSFGVKPSECFGLLGVNGAGKSTTFKMMTGEEIPNYGSMYLGNIDIRKDHNYLTQMGYCPQNDAIVRSLNSYDHLSLFARLRGIPEHQIKDEVKVWIKRLNLNDCASQPSGTYSGGNKRRLNIAMALIGIPNIVLLDEPTTGVDPAARRSLWNVIQSCQATGLAVILTSHSMEECEALCNRLTIMVNGKLKCIGPSQELKQRFGAGYDIQFKLNPMKSQMELHSIKRDMEESLDCEIMDENSGYLMCHISSTNITWRRMYDAANELKNRYASIEDFSVLSSTLEQLFLLFARAADNYNSRSR